MMMCHFHEAVNYVNAHIASGPRANIRVLFRVKALKRAVAAEWHQQQKSVVTRSPTYACLLLRVASPAAGSVCGSAQASEGGRRAERERPKGAILDSCRGGGGGGRERERE